MNKEILDTLDNLSKRPTTGLAMQLMETMADNMAKDKELERYKNIIDELIEYGENCLENLKDQDNYICESIDIVGLLQMIHIMYLEKLRELKGE